MAFESKRVTQLDELTSLSPSDYYVIVDASDLTQGADGTTKKISHATLLGVFGGGGASPTTDAGDLVTGTLSDARLSVNVTRKGNTFNGTNQLVQLDGTGKYPSNDGSQITNLNASNIASGEINDNRIPSTVARTRRIITPVNIPTGVSLTDAQTNHIFRVAHATGTVVFNLGPTITPGAFFTICTMSVGDVQISSASGLIIQPSALGNVSLPGRIAGGRRVEIVCLEPNVFIVSGDLI
jgi:hypothetical protein